ncbi:MULTISPECIES: GNAT family N-acetyltransferase [unclassified Pseudonocardia]|uniref:GNAT family N-acetyltransferase n=1 Tax=unclassified Pseudonocardia TaxID=2619320 RepID=UPI00095CFB3A|nr:MULTISPECIES: GNAT family N-acetyltransferase [unclassified Pseudonocardia]MBN9101634.1 GNAT family N-acetyltransferase [Pseudonocardia sp.]OJY40428.1 MAG: hypothetical protein BGP03_14190 [Pseudonocardia sp. 73-21]
MTHPVTVLGTEELRAAHDLFGGALFNGPVDDEGWEFRGASYAPGRTLGVHLDGTLAGTAMSFGTTTVVPGGAVLEAAAVTRVAVRADRTRRGVLSAMMRAQLDDVADRGEAVASLRATEARIYGRFGYGVATRGRSVRLRGSGAGWRPGAPASGSVRMLGPGEIIDVLSGLHERLALRRTGGITRSDGWWRAVVGRRLQAREPVIAAVHTGADGDDGYVVATPGARDGFTRPLHVEDLHAADAAATAALWRFVRDIDLVGDVEAHLRPLDEPLELLLADPRDCTVTGVADETWLRLVDVPTALAARTWAAADPVLLAVHDPFLERNAGVYRIADGTAERVGPLGGAVVPGLECDVAALAMAYLGDRTPSELAATGWWTCHDEKAPARADAAFATDVVPWCGTFF